MFPMEEDDIIFQVDKNDLIQGPTLAELNANDESLLCDLNFDDFVLPVQMSIASRSRSYAAAISNVNQIQFQLCFFVYLVYFWLFFSFVLHFVRSVVAECRF